MKTIKPKCGHSHATCNGDICLKDGEAHWPSPQEFQIERDWEARADQARAMYHMAVHDAEVELDAALARAEGIRQAELAQARTEAHRAAERG